MRVVGVVGWCLSPPLFRKEFMFLVEGFVALNDEFVVIPGDAVTQRSVGMYGPNAPGGELVNEMRGCGVESFNAFYGHP